MVVNLHMGAGNHTLVLRKSSQCSKPPPHLSSPYLELKKMVLRFLVLQSTPINTFTYRPKCREMTTFIAVLMTKQNNQPIGRLCEIKHGYSPSLTSEKDNSER